MMRKLKSWTLLIVLATGPFLVASDSVAEADKDGLKVSAVRAYLAQRIDTGETVGRFLQIWALVLMSDATRAKVDTARSLPKYLVPRLEVNGKQILPCGTGGRLPQMWSPFMSQEPSDLIAPLFFLPEDGYGVVELIVAVERRSEVLTPLARAPVSWDREIVDGARAARAQLLSVETEEAPSYKSQGSQMMQAVRLRLPAGLARVLGGGSGEIHCGDERAEDLSPDVGADVVIAWFERPVDARNCPWDLRFPALGVKLKLELSKPVSGDEKHD